MTLKMAPKFYLFVFLFNLLLLGLTNGDYQCVCNYNIEVGVMPSASDQGKPIGFLYEFDCKENIQPLNTNEWLAIAFEHKVGYIKADSQTQEQICQGSAPPMDKVTTTTLMPTTTTQMTTPSTTSSTTTPTPTQSLTSSLQTTTSTTFKPPTKMTTTQKTTIRQPTTSTKTSTTSTPSTTTTTITTTRTTTTKTSTSTTSTSTTTRPTSTTTILTRPTTTTSSSMSTVRVVSGKPSLCSSALRTRVHTERNILTQYGNSCYEIVTNGQAPWVNAETYCKSYGGHLVAIDSLGEQIFITNYLRHNFYHDVWTGLSHQGNNNKLSWSTGAPVSFTYWNSSVNNVGQSSNECVMLSPSRKGTWYEKPCQTPFNYICEFGLQTSITAAPYIIHTNPATTKTTTTTLPSSSVLISGRPEMCPASLIYHVKDVGSHLTQYGNTCYEAVEDQMTWSKAELYCSKFGGHLVTIDDSQEQDFIYRYLSQYYKHSIWIGLSDSVKEGNYQWVSGSNTRYRNWYQYRNDYASSFEDCALLTVYHNGQWDDRECSSPHSFMCEYNINGAKSATTPMPNVPSVPGDISRCPWKIRSKSNQDGGNLGYYQNSCYELIPGAKVSHEHALEMCYNRGGELVDILNQAEQNYVQAFLQMFSPQHAVWTGLHDKYTENYFEWDSGARVKYTNWLPGHTSNFVSHRQEDCVVIIPYTDGKWDDIPCGNQDFLFGDSGETHPPLCEYRVTNSKDFQAPRVLISLLVVGFFYAFTRNNSVVI